MKQVILFDLIFESVRLSEAARMVVQAAQDRQKGLVVTPNVDHVVSIAQDKKMEQVFKTAMFRFADGMPLVWFSRIACPSGLPERVTGADLLFAVAEQASCKNLSIFLLGGLPGVADKAADRLKNLYPGLRIAGTYCPPFGFESDSNQNRQIVDLVNASKADILFIGVGTPKQEKWASEHLDELQVGPILGVGAAFDFAAGTLKRAPKWIQSYGFEWLWRLLSEPKRLWRRYLLKDSKFLFIAIKELYRIKLNSRYRYIR